MIVTARASLDALVLNGVTIVEAIAPATIHDLLGNPSRIVAAGPPAPYGHRNNHIHVYDSLGIYFNEHHHTRLLEGMSFVYWPEEEGFAFTPAAAFSGSLQVADYEIPVQVSERELFARCDLPIERVLGGHWAVDGTIFIDFETKGAKLKSGRRSAARRLVRVSIGWAHDPHGAPRTGRPS